jgi:hypothetical protein
MSCFYALLGGGGIANRNSTAVGSDEVRRSPGCACGVAEACPLPLRRRGWWATRRKEGPEDARRTMDPLGRLQAAHLPWS